MEFRLPVLLSFLLFFLMLVRHWKRSKGQGKPPPGPKPLPILGNLHQLADGLPHYAVTKLCRKYGPVMKLKLGQLDAVVISSPEAAKEVLKTNEIKFAQRPEVYAVEIMSYDHSSIVFSPYGDYWREMRKISVLELLSNRRVTSFRSIREDEVWNLVQFISENEGCIVNLSERIFIMTNDIVSRAAFGNKCDDQHNFTALLEEILQIGAGFAIADLYPSLTFLRPLTGMKPALERIHKKMDKILEQIVTEHQIKRKAAAKNNTKFEEEDLVDTLLNYAEANKNEFHLTTDQVKAVTLDIFSAGSETSATSMEWAMSELLKNPRVMKKAQEEVRQACKGKSKIKETDIQNLEYLKLVIKETFRLHAPGPFTPREARETCEIGGYTIPAKAKILINLHAMGRDPTIWKDPECFRPERFEGSSIDFKGNHFELIPFGGGRRICPGISFATANIELGLAQMMYHFDYKLPNGKSLEDLDMNENFGMTCRRKENLQVIATTRIPFQK
ncbi:Cytochrome P450 [Melia azedarach]|uniref:Melianol synthase CYP71BQ5 n=2 Tax=Melia azedarach TaxID=155640 RepID=C1BQ5_MELAZ|nr:Cytochrome P450 [Melia azedarach]QDZ36307.1 CYP71BQ5 [Melia azedarach]